MKHNETPGKGYLDTELPLAERVEDLIRRLTLEEKISQMIHDAPGIERLGIKPFSWWNESLHGVARAGLATVFPQVIGLAATFNRQLLRRIGEAVSDEARAKHEVFLERGHYGRYSGLTFWAPNVNIFRDPRWGRGQETYGEDPYLTAEMAAEYVRGLQGDDERYLKTAAGAKHFAVHSGPEKVRHEFDAVVSPYDLHDTYLPAFKKLVTEANVETVMGAYNRTNGEPCCGSDFLLRKTLREDWGFQGHVVSDCWALKDFHLHHKVTNTAAESVALALKSGCDLNCGDLYFHLIDALVQGLVTEADMDTALRRLFRTRFKLGEFDPKDAVPFRSIGRERVHCDEHVALSREAAVESMVLLKNDGTLPINRKEVKSIYICGPNAMAVEALVGNYYGLSPRMVTFVEGLIEGGGLDMKTEFRHGSLLAESNKIATDWASFDAQHFDMIVACVGLNILVEGEEGDAIASPEHGDRTDISLPEGQHRFLLRILELGKPVVLVVSAGSPIDLSPYHDKVAAIVYSWYPGEQGGFALSDLLFGERDFTGKLPLSFPERISDLPSFDDYRMDNRTYRYAKWKSFYPFGFGLNYRPLSLVRLEVDTTAISAPKGLELRCVVTNPHRTESSDTLQVYIHKEINGARTPIWELADFARITVAPLAATVVTFRVGADRLKIVGDNGEQRFEKGTLEIRVGNSQPDDRSRELGAQVPLSASIVLEL